MPALARTDCGSEGGRPHVRQGMARAMIHAGRHGSPGDGPRRARRPERVKAGEVEGNDTMRKIALDARAGEVSAELARRGIAAEARVHVLVEVVGEEADLPPMTAIAEAGGAFDWLAEEPDLYTDADLVRPRTG